MGRGLNVAVCRIAARKLVNKVLQIRRFNAGELLKVIRCVKSISIKSKEDFGNGCHSAATEPYVYDAAYKLVKRDTAIPINKQGQCIVAVEITPETELQSCTWECSNECKPISEGEVDAILCLKAAFDLSVEDVRAALNTCDFGCPYGHYTKLVNSTPLQRKGHPIVCYCGNECGSQLRILRAASTHFPILRTFLHQIHSAIVCHKCVCKIDQALSAGDYSKLMEITGIKNIESLLSNDVDLKYEQIKHNNSYLRQPDLEEKLVVTHAALITELEKEIDDFPEDVCCCWERLNQRKSISVVRLSDNFNSDVWPDLKCHILKNNPDAAKEVLYMCFL